jgi:hypothetical protein
LALFLIKLEPTTLYVTAPLNSGNKRSGNRDSLKKRQERERCDTKLTNIDIKRLSKRTELKLKRFKMGGIIKGGREKRCGL